MRPCIKYQQQTNKTVSVPQRCHQLLSETEPALMDEQPLTDVDPLPALSDHEPYLDSLEECDDHRQTTTDGAAVEQPVVESEQSSVSEHTTVDVDVFPASEPEPVTESSQTNEANESVQPAAVTDAESVIAAETRSKDDVQQESAEQAEV